jgi:drug/metabolite transporter (DMT)-like permease
MLMAMAGWCLVFAPAIVLARALRQDRPGWRAFPVALALVVGAVLFALRGRNFWFTAARALPLVVVAAGTHSLVQFVRGRERKRTAMELAFAVLALVLLGKMILNARIQQYGFVLALPATLLAATTISSRLPRVLDRRRLRGDFLRAAAVAVFVVAGIAHLRATAWWTSRKSSRPAAGANSFRADPRGDFAAEAMKELRARMAPGATLAVFPEGVMLNFLLYARNPTSYVNFMPPEFLFFGEDRILAAFQSHPPDFVALVHKETREYGYPLFGRDYGQSLMAWVRETYAPVVLLGDEPLVPGARFGVQILARK